MFHIIDARNSLRLSLSQLTDSRPLSPLRSLFFASSLAMILSSSKYPLFLFVCFSLFPFFILCSLHILLFLDDGGVPAHPVEDDRIGFGLDCD